MTPCASLFRHLRLLQKLLEFLGGNYCGISLRGSVAARHASSCIGTDVRVRRSVAVGESLEKRDDLILLLIRQTEHTGCHIDIRRDLGHGPAIHLFHRSCRALPGLDGEWVHVARVVEVDELFQALDVTVVEKHSFWKYGPGASVLLH